MKKIILIILILLPIVVGATNLDVNYPDFLGNEDYVFADKDISEMVPYYLRYAFTVLVIVSGIIVFGSLVYSGFIFLTSAGNPTAYREAKDRITSSIVGVVIILGSILILRTINPQIVDLENLKITSPGERFSPGVYLIDNQDNKYYMTNGQVNIEEVGLSNIVNVCFVNSYYIITEEEDGSQKEELIGDRGALWTTILHSDTNGLGQCLIKVGSDMIYRVNTTEMSFDKVSNCTPVPLNKFRALSVTTFAQSRQIISNPDNDIHKAYGFSGTEYSQDRLELLAQQGPITQNMSTSPSTYKSLYKLANNINSIKIPRNKLVLLTEASKAGGGIGTTKCQVFIGDIPDLTKQPIHRCNPSKFFIITNYESCANHYVTFRLRL